jgi:hypothetical protein
VLARAENLAKELETRQQYMIWGGVRDAQYAATHCDQITKDILGVTSNWLNEFADRGQELYKEADAYLGGLEVEHPEHPGRSLVRKDNWKEFNRRYNQHLDTAGVLRLKAQADPIRQTYAYDSLKGWCQARNK